jgi:homoserine kinase
MMARPPSATAFAPGGVGNMGPGLDILGLALDGLGDTVRAEWIDGPGIRMLDAGHTDLPKDSSSHTAGLAARAVLKRANDPRSRTAGVGLTVKKGLPLSGGQGGSAASAVAAAVAVNALLGTPLDRGALLGAALDAEEGVSGRHADNIAPSLLGGIVLIRSIDPLDLIQLPVLPELYVVIVCPHQQLRTADARRVLPAQVDRAVAIHQAAQVGAIVAALSTGDYELLGRSIDDRIAEPPRAALLPGFRPAKQAALNAGALGSSISGSGPSAFALVRGAATGERVAAAMSAAYAASGLASSMRICGIDRVGARLLPDDQEQGG